MWEHVVYVAVGLTAVTVAWRKAVWPIVKGATRFARAVEDFTAALPDLLELAAFAPVILDIAAEFQPNEGSSLRDRIDKLNLDMDTLTGQMEEALTRDPSERTRSTDL